MENLNTSELNPGKIKLELLINGISPDSNIQMREREAPERFVYDTSNKYRGVLPSEIILPDNIVSNIYLREGSDWSIQGRMLKKGNQNLCEVSFTPDAKFTKMNLKSGMPASKVAVMYGLDIFSVFLNKTCVYFPEDKECHFCSLEYTRKNSGKGNVVNPTVNQVAEAFQLALDHDSELFNYVMVTSGAYRCPDKGIEKQMAHIQMMKQIQGRKNVNYHLVTIPPKSREILKQLAEQGPDTVAFDIEVFNPNLFRKNCPGKETQIGYEAYLRIFEDAAKMFPDNAVKAGFVCGLEPIDSLVEGMEFFGRLGIPSSLNIFHPDVGSKLQDKQRPDRGYLLEILKEQARIGKRYNLIPIFPVHGRRSSLDTEVHKGYFQ
ncbi:radical SAM protein [Candidatus Woesearchaeota archaeon]|nr:radical SAM protein [Candidatus Woesearchaeota archaeon]